MGKGHNRRQIYYQKFDRLPEIPPVHAAAVLNAFVASCAAAHFPVPAPEREPKGLIFPSMSDLLQALQCRVDGTETDEVVLRNHTATLRNAEEILEQYVPDDSHALDADLVKAADSLRFVLGGHLKKSAHLWANFQPAKGQARG